jgi:preprotein translocase subunit SecE
LVEHWSPKPGVGSSSLSSRAKNEVCKMKIINYFKESYNELLHKVTWPSWQELQGSATLVLVTSVLLAVVIWAMDFSFDKIMSFVYSLFYV